MQSNAFVLFFHLVTWLVSIPFNRPKIKFQFVDFLLGCFFTASLWYINKVHRKVRLEISTVIKASNLMKANDSLTTNFSMSYSIVVFFFLLYMSNRLLGNILLKDIRNREWKVMQFNLGLVSWRDVVLYSVCEISHMLILVRTQSNTQITNRFPLT